MFISYTAESERFPRMNVEYKLDLPLDLRYIFNDVLQFGINSLITR